MKFHVVLQGESFVGCFEPSSEKINLIDSDLYSACYLLTDTVAEWPNKECCGILSRKLSQKLMREKFYTFSKNYLRRLPYESVHPN